MDSELSVGDDEASSERPRREHQPLPTDRTSRFPSPCHTAAKRAALSGLAHGGQGGHGAARSLRRVCTVLPRSPRYSSPSPPDDDAWAGLLGFLANPARGPQREVARLRHPRARASRASNPTLADSPLRQPLVTAHSHPTRPMGVQRRSHTATRCLYAALNSAYAYGLLPRRDSALTISAHLRRVPMRTCAAKRDGHSRCSHRRRCATG